MTAEESQPPEEKRAAIVRRGAEREKRDLFASREDDIGSVKQTLLPPPSYGFNNGQGVGARNENSVLFRVDQLANSRLKTPPPIVASHVPVAPSSDEGVIDLKALSSAPPALQPVALPIAPLFSEPPPTTFDVDEHQRRQPKPTSKAKIVGLVAAAAAFLVILGFGLKVAFKTEEPVKHTPAATVVPPPPAPVVTATPSADPAPSASETADSSDAKESKGKKGKHKKGKSAGPITNKSPIPQKKAVKPADPCGCHGDFNCILACTAKGGK